MVVGKIICFLNFRSTYGAYVVSARVSGQSCMSGMPMWMVGEEGVLAELGILLFDIDATGEADILPRARVIGVGPGLEGVTCLLGGLPERPASNAIGLMVEYRCSVAERV